MEDEFNYYAEAVIADPATAAWVLPLELISLLKGWLGFNHCRMSCSGGVRQVGATAAALEPGYDPSEPTEENSEALFQRETERHQERAAVERRRGYLISVPLYLATKLDTLYMWACFAKWFCSAAPRMAANTNAPAPRGRSGFFLTTEGELWRSLFQRGRAGESSLRTGMASGVRYRSAA